MKLIHYPFIRVCFSLMIIVFLVAASSLIKRTPHGKIHPILNQKQKSNADPYFMEADEFEKEFEEKMQDWRITPEIMDKVINFKQLFIGVIWVEALDLYPKFVLTCMKEGTSKKISFEDPIPVFSLNDAKRIEMTLSHALKIPLVSIQEYDDAEIYFLQEQLGGSIALTPFNIETQLPRITNDEKAGEIFRLYVRTPKGVGVIKSSDLHCPENTARYIFYNPELNKKRKKYRYKLESSLVKQLSIETGIPKERMRYLFDNANIYLILKRTRPKDPSKSNQIVRMVFAYAADMCSYKDCRFTAAISRRDHWWCLHLELIPEKDEVYLDNNGMNLSIDRGEVVSTRIIPPVPINEDNDICNWDNKWNEKGEIYTSEPNFP